MLQLRALVDEEDAAWNGAKETISRTCGDWRHTCLPGHITRLGQRAGPELPGEGAETTLDGVSGRCVVSLTLGERRAGLEDFQAALSWKDTEDQDDKGDGGQHDPQVGHSQVLGGGGSMVGEDTVQADKQQPSGEGHTSSDVM